MHQPQALADSDGTNRNRGRRRMRDYGYQTLLFAISNPSRLHGQFVCLLEHGIAPVCELGTRMRANSGALGQSTTANAWGNRRRSETARQTAS